LSVASSAGTNLKLHDAELDHPSTFDQNWFSYDQHKARHKTYAKVLSVIAGCTDDEAVAASYFAVSEAKRIQSERKECRLAAVATSNASSSTHPCPTANAQAIRDQLAREQNAPERRRPGVVNGVDPKLQEYQRLQTIAIFAAPKKVKRKRMKTAAVRLRCKKQKVGHAADKQKKKADEQKKKKADEQKVDDEKKEAQNLSGPRGWSKDEDKQLSALVKGYRDSNNTVKWKVVAKEFSWWTKQQCQKRSKYIGKAPTTKGPWLTTEDQVIKDGMLAKKPPSEIATALGRRLGDVNRRWRMILNTDILSVGDLPALDVTSDMRVDQFIVQKTSVHAGVTWDKRTRMWLAKTSQSAGRRREQLGSFTTEDEAARVAAQARADMADAAKPQATSGRGTTQEATDATPEVFDRPIATMTTEEMDDAWAGLGFGADAWA
jgi:hypothetical protein